MKICQELVSAQLQLSDKKFFVKLQRCKKKSVKERAKCIDIYWMDACF